MEVQVGGRAVLHVDTRGPTWNISLHCVNACRCDGFNKEADWPIPRPEKVRRENQTKRMLGRGMLKTLPHQREESEAM